MKNLIRKSLVAAVLFTALLSYGKGIDPKKRINDEKTTPLTLRNVEKGNKLLVKDFTGIVLYQETIKKSGVYLKGFDLTALPDGEYFFELDKAIQTEIIPFVVKNQKAKVKRSDKNIIYKPYVRANNNLVFVSNLSLDKTPLRVEIFYYGNNTSFGDKIFSETIKNALDIQRAYKLDESKTGTYKIVLSTGENTFIEYFKY